MTDNTPGNWCAEHDSADLASRPVRCGCACSAGAVGLEPECRRSRTGAIQPKTASPTSACFMRQLICLPVGLFLLIGAMIGHGRWVSRRAPRTPSRRRDRFDRRGVPECSRTLPTAMMEEVFGIQIGLGRNQAGFTRFSAATRSFPSSVSWTATKAAEFFNLLFALFPQQFAFCNFRIFEARFPAIASCKLSALLSRLNISFPFLPVPHLGAKRILASAARSQLQGNSKGRGTLIIAIWECHHDERKKSDCRDSKTANISRG